MGAHSGENDCKLILFPPASRKLRKLKRERAEESKMEYTRGSGGVTIPGGGGVSTIKGEIHSIMTLLRLNTRWSQPGGRNGSQSSFFAQEENPFIRSFRRLNEYLEGLYDLRDVDCVMYISPFHQVIVSDQASGPLTSAALSSLSKFALYGFLDSSFPRVREGISLIASCISRCVFEETDWESDEVILMKLLELSALSLRCDASSLLTVGAAWDIYSTCISIHSQYRASKILRSEAETALRHMTLATFSKAHRAFLINAPMGHEQPQIMDDSTHISSNSNGNNGNSGNITSSNSNSSLNDMSNGVNRNLTIATNRGVPDSVTLGPKTVLSGDEDSALLTDPTTAEKINAIFMQEQRNQSWETMSQQLDFSGPVGVTLLLGKIMTVLSGLMNLQKQTIEKVKLSLSLINIALEAGGPALGSMGPLVDVLRGDVCRHLLRASQSEDLAVFSLSLRVVFNLFMSIKDHMKVQLEVFLTSVHLRLLMQSPSQGQSMFPAKEELALESLLEFCREPSLMHDLYTNYDCDVQCTNLFDSIIATLCERAIPYVQQGNIDNERSFRNSNATSLTGEWSARVNILNRLALDGVFAVLHAVAARCYEGSLDTSNDEVVQSNTLLVTDSPRQSKSLPFDGPDAAKYVSNGLDSSVLSMTIDTAHNGDNHSVSSTPTKASLNGDCRPTSQDVELEVDRWCSSEPGSPAANDYASQDMLDPTDESSKDKIHTPPKLINSQLRRNDSSPFSSSEAMDMHHVNSANGLRDMASYTGRESSPSISQQQPLSSYDEGDSDVLLARVKTAEILRQRKLKKQRLRLAAEKFNEQPLKAEWLKFSLELGLIHFANTDTPILNGNGDNSSAISSMASSAAALAVKGNHPDDAGPRIDPKSVANFLKDTPGLGKTQVGEYLSKGPVEMYPFHAQVLKAYVDTFDFSEKTGSSFDKALRSFLGHFRLPGEAQCIDRLMEAFAGKLFENLGVGNPFASADAAFILAFSTIMLNTDLHNPNLPANKRMTKEEFLRNNRKINDGEDLPRQYLETLYDEIKTRQIQVDVDINDSGVAAASLDFTDTATWNKLLRKSAADQAPAAFTPTVAARKGAAGQKGHSGGVLSFPLSIHEKDMFLVMAKPVLGTIITVWEMTDDDQIVRRILEGIWDHATVCVGFNILPMLSKTIEVLAMWTKVILSHSRRFHRASSKAQNRLSLMESQLRRMQREGKQFNLEALVEASFSSLISSQRLVSGPPDAAGVINWEGAHIIRGELMIKSIFYITSRFPQHLEGDAWGALIQLLLWVRHRAALPRSLAKLSDITIGESSCRLPLSSYARDCLWHLRSNSAKSLQDSSSAGRSSWWSWWSNADDTDDQAFENGHSGANEGDDWDGLQGGKLGNGAGRKRGKGLRKRSHSFDRHVEDTGGDEIDGNGTIFSIGDVVSTVNSSANKADTEYLKRAIIFSQVDNVLFQSSNEWDDSQLLLVFGELLEALSDILSSSLTSRNSMTSTRSQSDMADGDSNIPSENFLDQDVRGMFGSGGRSSESDSDREFDAILLLEWLSSMVLINKHRAPLLWSKMHSFFKCMLEDSIDILSVNFPYFIERCVVTIITATSQLSSSPPPPPPPIPQLDSKYASAANSLSPTSTNSGLSFVWLSLRLLRGIPSEIFSNISDRFAAGILSLLRHSPGVQLITTLEQWYIIFSLLSAASCGAGGRPYVWDAVCFLIDKHLVNDMNLTPCRHLVLRFLHGVFPGDLDEEQKFQDPSSRNSNAVNPWLLESMTNLMKITTMALAGYKSVGGLTNNANSSNKFNTAAQPSGSLRLSSISDGNSSSSSQLSSKSIPNSGSSVSISSDKTAKMTNQNMVTFPLPPPFASSQLTVVSVELPKKEEVELLWLESCKTFADIANSMPADQSQRATFCLQSIFISGGICGLPDGLWFKALIELVNIMPINLAATSNSKKFAMANEDEVIECCLRSCNVIFEMMVTHIKQLRKVKDFPSYWLRFISVLATNANLLMKGVAMHEEMLEMIAALLRLLRPPPLPPQAPSKPEVSPVPQSKQKGGGIFQFLWGFSNDASPSPSPPPPPPPPSGAATAAPVIPSISNGTNNGNAPSTTSTTPTNNTNTPVAPSAIPPPHVQSPQNGVDMNGEGGVTANSEGDAKLLCLCWKTICSLYPSLPATLRLKYAQLVSDLTRHIEIAETRELQLQKQQQQQQHLQLQQQLQQQHQQQQQKQLQQQMQSRQASYVSSNLKEKLPTTPSPHAVTPPIPPPTSLHTPIASHVPQTDTLATSQNQAEVSPTWKGGRKVDARTMIV